MIKDDTNEYSLPLIRFVNKEQNDVFLDHFGRIYKSWNDFTEWNELPECVYCFPEEGWYRKSEEGEVLVGYKESPPVNKIIEQIVKYLGIVENF